jgi:hypothetical protein
MAVKSVVKPEFGSEAARAVVAEHLAVLAVEFPGALEALGKLIKVDVQGKDTSLVGHGVLNRMIVAGDY